MKSLRLFGSILMMFFVLNLSAQNGWFVQSTINSNPYTITAIEFSSLNDGFLVANNGTFGYIFQTFDGGNSWMLDTSFAQNLTRMSYNSGKWFVVGNGGVIYKTTTNTDWVLQTSNTTANLNDVQFINSDTGFVVGVGGVLRKTVDGGQTWTNPVVSGSTYDFNSVYFTDANNGVIVGVYNFFNGFAIRTTSGGGYFGVPATMASKLNKVVFTSPQIGYAVGNGGVIYKTTNAGAGWQIKSSGVTTQLWDVSFVNDTIGWVVGESGTIIKTTDGGTTWQSQISPVNTHLRTIFSHTDTLLHAAGDSSIVIKTSTGGASLTVNVSDTAVYCNGYANLNATTTYNGSGTLQYIWNSDSLLSDTSIQNPIAGPISQQAVFYVTVTDGTISATDSCIVSTAILPADSICLVSVLDSLNHNVIVFEKHVQGPIDYYIIHKETTTANVYDSIGFIPADSAGVFIDPNVNPAVQAYRYKLSSVDSCGNESALSNHHKTIHLTINQGIPGTWNLIWNNYEGVFVNTYRIWRGDSLNNLVLLDSVAGNMTSYTDMNILSTSAVYQIEVVSSYMCLPYNYKAQTNYNTSRSNKYSTQIPPHITANFSANPTTGLAPLTVFFNDVSMGSVDTYLWDFGDGDTAMIANPSHTYTSIGVYDVKLVVKSGLLADSITKNAFIDVISSIEDINLSEGLKVYPNPSENQNTITVETGGAFIQTIVISDAVGRQVRSFNDLNTAKATLDISGIQKGIYYLNLTSVGGKTANKVIVIQ